MQCNINSWQSDKSAAKYRYLLTTSLKHSLKYLFCKYADERPEKREVDAVFILSDSREWISAATCSFRESRTLERTSFISTFVLATTWSTATATLLFHLEDEFCQPAGKSGVLLLGTISITAAVTHNFSILPWWLPQIKPRQHRYQAWLLNVLPIRFPVEERTQTVMALIKAITVTSSRFEQLATTTELCRSMREELMRNTRRYDLYRLYLWSIYYIESMFCML